MRDAVTDPQTLLLGGLVLAALTYGLRLAGPWLMGRVEEPERLDRLVGAASVVLLAAVVATTGLTQDGGFAGVARTAGVGLALVLAAARAPFLVVVVAAAALTAALRALGVA